MVNLDYGSSVFNGFERWLEIAVKPDSAPGHTTLTPRQKINPTPYATFARTIYRRTVVVKPVGSYSANGLELLQAYESIIDDGPGLTNRYLLKSNRVCIRSDQHACR